MTNTEIYELLEQNADIIQNPKKHRAPEIVVQIIKTQNKILRELLADIPEAGNDNTVRIGD